MAQVKVKSEGGQGGKKGHSNMTHWTFTSEIKASANKQRRLDDSKTIKEQVNE